MWRDRSGDLFFALFFQFLDNHITFQAADAVNVQNTVQMVGFVLQNNRKIVFRIQRLFFAVVVQIAYGYGAVALDFGALSGNGEAAFVKPRFGLTKAASPFPDNAPKSSATAP